MVEHTTVKRLLLLFIYLLITPQRQHRRTQTYKTRKTIHNKNCNKTTNMQPKMPQTHVSLQL